MFIIGHRGACGYKPENTLASIKKALEIGVDAVEIDVRKTADDAIVLMHDYTIDRSTNGSGRVAELTLSELEKYNAGNSQKIPTLQEAIDLVDQQAIIDIDIKEKEVVPYIYNIIKKYIEKGWKTEDFIISSFDLVALRDLYKVLSDIKHMAIISNATEDWLHILEEVPISMIAVAHNTLYKDFVNLAHENELDVIPYTVNKFEDIKRMIDICVDGIISDYPDRIKESLL